MTISVLHFHCKFKIAYSSGLQIIYEKEMDYNSSSHFDFPAYGDFEAWTTWNKTGFSCLTSAMCQV